MLNRLRELTEVYDKVPIPQTNVYLVVTHGDMKEYCGAVGCQYRELYTDVYEVTGLSTLSEFEAIRLTASFVRLVSE